MKIGDLVRFRKPAVEARPRRHLGEVGKAQWVLDAAENKTPFLIVSVELKGRAIEVLFGQKLWFVDSCFLTSEGLA